MNSSQLQLLVAFRSFSVDFFRFLRFQSVLKEFVSFSITLDYSRLLSITLDYSRLPSITLDYSRLPSITLSLALDYLFVSFSPVWWLLTISRLSCLCFSIPYIFLMGGSSKGMQMAKICLEDPRHVKITSIEYGLSVLSQYLAAIGLFSLRDLEWSNQTTANKLMEQQLQQRKTHVLQKEGDVWGGAYVSRVTVLSKCLRIPLACLKPSQKHLELPKVS